MNKKVVATIQARMGSSRLPGKVLADIHGHPMLKRQINRLKRSRLIDEIIVATSTSRKDNQIEEFCIQNKIKVFRGSEKDVLGRIANLLEKFKFDIHVELYGDSPLLDVSIIDEMICLFYKYHSDYDYFSSSLKTTYPPGLEVSVYFSEILLKVNNLIKINDPLREEVGYNITRFPKMFKQYSVEAPKWFNYPEIYLEVDTKNDLDLIKNIYAYFIKKGMDYFSLDRILEFLEFNKELIELNNKEERRWKKYRID